MIPTKSPSKSSSDLHLSRERLSNFIRDIRSEILFELSPKSVDELQHLKLALNEAEALAFSTPFPGLMFPALASEKIKSWSEWQRRQNGLRSQDPMAFAE